ncbi:MAG: hypothetical protein KIT27_08055 [Legionellales bacterium]|nr:hypothetical protein [Legionellales bacterium]
MQWASLGFSGNPFNTDPITQSTLALYAGQDKSIQLGKNLLHEENLLIVIEGARGVGTTSFANFLRFSAQEKKLYFTPNNEIRVGPSWSLETLLGSIIANIIREMELALPNSVLNEKAFQDAKALTIRIAETYRSFGIDALGFGINYGKSAGITSQPVLIPSAVLGHHLEDLAKLIQSAGYKNGVLLQLNNLDLGEIQDEKHLKYLFNELRDYIQTKLVSWFLVGDIGLRKFIAQQVDRLDDIVSFEFDIEPLNKSEYEKLIKKRVDFYKINEKSILPIDDEVFFYLFDLTKGRLRYVFGLIKRLTSKLLSGELVDKLSLDIVKPAVIKLAKERLEKNALTSSDQEILSRLVKDGTTNATTLAKTMGKTRQYISKKLVHLHEMSLLEVKQKGTKRIYSPVLDVTIAYTD